MKKRHKVRFERGGQNSQLIVCNGSETGGVARQFEKSASANFPTWFRDRHWQLFILEFFFVLEKKSNCTDPTLKLGQDWTQLNPEITQNFKE